MSAPSGFDYRASLLPPPSDSVKISGMSGGGIANTANSFWQSLLTTCSKKARDFTIENKTLVKKTETRLSGS
jgi:hypothetical protein